jgi:hypothetical protein
VAGGAQGPRRGGHPLHTHEMVVVTIDGRRRKITKREAIGTQMVKSASADLRATKMLDRHDERRRAQGRRRCTAARTPPLAAADKEVVQLFVARLRRQILQETEEAASSPGAQQTQGGKAGAHSPFRRGRAYDRRR